MCCSMLKTLKPRAMNKLCLSLRLLVVALQFPSSIRRSVGRIPTRWKASSKQIHQMKAINFLYFRNKVMIHVAISSKHLFLGRSVPWRMSNSHALFLCYECMIHDGCELIAQFIFISNEYTGLIISPPRKSKRGRISRGRHTQHADVALSPFLLLCKTHKNLRYLQITRERILREKRRQKRCKV
jgi:hypothetical protein